MLAVFQDQTLAGELRRTPLGCEFTYVPQFLAGKNARPICFNMPLQTEPFRIQGINLLPFFANLLPEGLRYDALVRRAKTSRDDRFTLLAMSGSQTIGDIWVQSDEPGTALPRVDLATTTFAQVWDDETRISHSAIAGVQPKISGRRLAIAAVGITNQPIILKLNESEEKYPRLLQSEHFFMNLAVRCGMETARTQLVSDREGADGLLVHRFDRVRRQRGEIMLHVEDGCQLLDAFPDSKYATNLLQVGRAVAKVVTAPIVEIHRLIELCAYSYVIANGDLHAKNISVYRTEKGVVRLAPAYDLLSTWPYGDHAMALPAEGKKSGWNAHLLVAFGNRFGVSESAIRGSLNRIASGCEVGLEGLHEIGLPAKQTRALQNVMRDRIRQIKTSV